MGTVIFMTAFLLVTCILVGALETLDKRRER